MDQEKLHEIELTQRLAINTISLIKGYWITDINQSLESARYFLQTVKMLSFEKRLSGDKSFEEIFKDLCLNLIFGSLATLAIEKLASKLFSKSADLVETFSERVQVSMSSAEFASSRVSSGRFNVFYIGDSEKVYNSRTTLLRTVKTVTQAKDSMAEIIFKSAFSNATSEAAKGTSEILVQKKLIRENVDSINQTQSFIDGVQLAIGFVARDGGYFSKLISYWSTNTSELDKRTPEELKKIRDSLQPFYDDLVNINIVEVRTNFRILFESVLVAIDCKGNLFDYRNNISPSEFNKGPTLVINLFDTVFLPSAYNEETKGRYGGSFRIPKDETIVERLLSEFPPSNWDSHFSKLRDISDLLTFLNKKGYKLRFEKQRQPLKFNEIKDEQIQYWLLDFYIHSIWEKIVSGDIKNILQQTSLPMQAPSKLDPGYQMVQDLYEKAGYNVGDL